MAIPIDEYQPDEDGGGGGGGVGYVPPPQASGDWARIAQLVDGRTDYRSVNFLGQADGSTTNLNGVYSVTGVTPDTITLADPSAVNPNWDNIAVETGAVSASLSTEGEQWVGSFVIDLVDLDRVVNNFVALGGLYQINKKGKQSRVSVNVLVELRPVDSNGNPSGPAETFTATLVGSNNEKQQIGYTLDAQPTFTGRARVRARRTSPTDLNFDGTLVDEVKWRDAYGLADIGDIHFGDVTTALVRTYATTGATSVKNRKFNLTARRRLPARVGGSEFTTGLTGTDRVDDIISAISLDPYIGNYAPELVDFDNIYDTAEQIESYFGSERAVEFGFTFDDDNISFEETLAVVANCCFSRAYRQGSLIRISFERAQDSGVLLFNHRNVIPRSQQRSRTFGVQDDHDGVEFDWTAAKDGATLTYDIPYDRSAVSPRRVEVPGVRSGELAYWHSWRAWNRLQFQTQTLEQEATQEAALVLPADRVIVTDLTRPPGYEGEILSAENGGLDLELSQPAPDFVDGVSYVIFIQHRDRTTEALSVGPWTPAPGEEHDDYMVRLSTAPRLDLALGEGLSARPTYEIVPETDRRPRAWLISEREPNSDFTETVRAVNYSPMYYINDEVVMWLAFSEPSFRDQSPRMGDGSVLGSGAVVMDSERGKPVYSAAAADASVTFPALMSPASYAKAAWIRPAAGASGELLSSVGAGERFGLDGAGNLILDHAGSGVVSAPLPLAGEWHHVVATYDGASSSAALFVDGEEVARTEDMPRGPLAALTAFSGLVGRYDDLRLWKRALQPEEVRALFRSTRRPLV